MLSTLAAVLSSLLDLSFLAARVSLPRALVGEALGVRSGLFSKLIARLPPTFIGVSRSALFISCILYSMFRRCRA